MNRVRRVYSPAERRFLRARLKFLRARPWGQRGAYSKEYTRLSRLVWHWDHPGYAADYMNKYRAL